MPTYRPEITIQSPDGESYDFTSIEDAQKFADDNQIGNTDTGEDWHEPGFYFTENAFLIFNYDVPSMVGLAKIVKPNDLIEYADSQQAGVKRFVIANRGTKEERLYIQQPDNKAQRIYYHLSSYQLSGATTKGVTHYKIRFGYAGVHHDNTDLQNIYAMFDSKYGPKDYFWSKQDNLDAVYQEREATKRIYCVTNKTFYPSFIEARKDLDIPEEDIIRIIDTSVNYNGYQFQWYYPYEHED